MTPAEIFLTARDLHLAKGGSDILKIPALDLFKGEILALIGPNGAGKSTLLACLAALEPKAKGRITMGGEAVKIGENTLSYRRRISMVFQESLLFDTTVFENVATGLRLRGTSRSEINRRVEAMLSRLRISHLRSRSARTLSGGEAQRTSLARAMVLEPEILFLDEPLAALDPPTRGALLDDLDQALRATGSTALFATHDREEALRLADRMAVVMGGTIRQIGPPLAVMNHPLDAAIASFVGVETILPATVRESGNNTLLIETSGRMFMAHGTAAKPGDDVYLCIRAENVTLALGDGDKEKKHRNIFLARIVRLLPRGPCHTIELDCGFPLAAHVLNIFVQEARMKEGMMVTAAITPLSVHVIPR